MVEVTGDAALVVGPTEAEVADALQCTVRVAEQLSRRRGWQVADAASAAGEAVMRGLKTWRPGGGRTFKSWCCMVVGGFAWKLHTKERRHHVKRRPFPAEPV